MTSVFLVFILVGVLMPPITVRAKQVRSSSSPDDFLQRPVPGDELKYLSTTDAFHSSLGQARVAGGIVRVINCGNDPFKQAWRPKGSPLRQVLDAIVAADPRYRWEVQEGVVNLLPSTGEPALLGIHINEFYVKRISSTSDALRQLLSVPEVKKAMNELDLKPGVTLVKSLSRPNPPKFSVHYNGGTLRQALNAIARAHGSDVWQYIETHCEGRNEIVIRF